MVIDQGQHVLPKLAGSHVLVQVGIPGLEERARSVSPSTALVLSPGAPLTSLGCSLVHCSAPRPTLH